MRKTLTQALLAAFCAILARGTSAAHVEGGGVMQIASRVSMWSGARTPTAKDYVQDGLIAMWDGIENAGWGVHDPNATAWVDLTGNHSSVGTTSADLSWGEDCLLFANTANMTTSLIALEQKYGHGNGPMTIEQTGVFADDMGSAGFAIVQFRSGGDQSAGVVAGAVVSLPVTSRDDRYGTGKNAYFPWPTGLYNFGNVRGGDFIFSATTDGNTWGIYEKGALLFNNRNLGAWSWHNSTMRFLWATNSAGSKCNGKAYCIRLYSRALTAAEIAANYAIDKERFGLT